MEQIEEYIKTVIKEKLEMKKSYDKIMENDRQLVILLKLMLELVQSKQNKY